MRTNNSSGCLTAFVSSFSRIMLLCYWIARPAVMDATFNTFILPCLGFLILPFTTLMYVLSGRPAWASRASTGCGWPSPCCWTSPASAARATPIAIASPAQPRPCSGQ